MVNGTMIYIENCYKSEDSFHNRSAISRLTQSTRTTPIKISQASPNWKKIKS